MGSQQSDGDLDNLTKAQEGFQSYIQADPNFHWLYHSARTRLIIIQQRTLIFIIITQRMKPLLETFTYTISPLQIFQLTATQSHYHLHCSIIYNNHSIMINNTYGPSGRRGNNIWTFIGHLWVHMDIWEHICAMQWLFLIFLLSFNDPYHTHTLLWPVHHPLIINPLMASPDHHVWLQSPISPFFLFYFLCGLWGLFS